MMNRVALLLSLLPSVVAFFGPTALLPYGERCSAGALRLAPCAPALARSGRTATLARWSRARPFISPIAVPQSLRPDAGLRRDKAALSVQASAGGGDAARYADALVSFKGAPCLVTALSEAEEKATVLQLNRRERKAKCKDLQVVFPGPVRSWELQELEGKLPDPAEAPEQVHAELLSAGVTWTVRELAQKLFQTDATHLTSWAAWMLVQEGLYFTGTAQEVEARPAEQVAKDLEKIRAKKEAEKDKANFVKRVKEKKIKPADVDRMQDLVELALYRTDTSATLKLLGVQQTPQEAHKLLLDLGVWDAMTNPWPARFGVNMQAFSEELEQEAIKEIARAKTLKREDLTHLPAFAIDDADIADPDDAISVLKGEGETLQVWIHVADVGAVVRPGSALDLAARQRGATCYLPNGTLPMLPSCVQDSMALGLQETSPALSISFLLEEDGHIDDVKIVRSTVKVTRVSYAEAQALMETGEAPWSDMEEASFRFRDRRLENGAVGFQMPQADVKVAEDSKITVQVAEHYESKEMVMEMMLMAGEAVSQYALDTELPFIFSTQGPLKEVTTGKSAPKKQLQKGGRPPPSNPFEIAAAAKEANKEKREDRIRPPETLAEKFEFRKRFLPSAFKMQPDTHTGLGMPMYCQISSPLRRYGDLLLHQQLNAALESEPVLEEDQLLARIADTEGRVGAAKKAERFSSQFYTLHWLMQNPEWRGAGTCCALWQPRPGVPKIATVLLDDLAFFTNVRCKKDVKTDGEMAVKLKGVRIVDMKADMMHDAQPGTIVGTEKAEMYKKTAMQRKQVGTRMADITTRAG